MYRTRFIVTICAAVLAACGTAPSKYNATGQPRPSSPSKLTDTRIFCTPDNESHFESVMVDLAKIDAAPPAPPMYIITGGLPATRLNFAVFEPRWGAQDLAKGAYHAAPGAQFTTVLEGLMSITTSDRETRRFREGDVIRVEDISPCKGHISVNESDNLLSVMIVR
jgi:hypothetical protein